MRRLLVFLILCAPCFGTTWPGQVGNSVGYAAAPGWPGSFNATACPASPASGTSWSSPTIVTNCTYASNPSPTCNYCEFLYVDFAGSGGTWFQGSHILVMGCRFQSAVNGNNVSASGTEVYLLYNSFEPLTSVATSPPGSSWPSAGTGANSTTITSGVNATNGSTSYATGFTLNTGAGKVVIDHNDIWGFWNHGIQHVNGVTGPITITNNWIHDAADPTPQSGHTDGIGFENAGTAPNNDTIVGNTVATLGSDQAFAFQSATGGYTNIFVNDNYFSGDNATISFCQPGSVQCTNSTFYGNVWSATIAANGPLYAPGAALGTGSVWACNTVNIPSGTTWSELNSPFWAPSHTQDGQYFLNADPPNSTTDQGGNTYCGIPSPSSINFGNQGVSSSSAGTTITFSNTNSGTLSSISASLATGTQFSISANTCGSTLAASSSCSITVKFTPTGYGPQTDTLQIADNSSGVSSPQLVPLIGVGVTNSGVSVTNSKFMGIIR